MTEIYLFRHAEVEYPYDEEGRRLMYPPETPISEEGQNQLRQFAISLRNQGIHIDRIEYSDFVRATQSADIIAEVLAIPERFANIAFRDPHLPGYFGVPLSFIQELMDKGEDTYINPRSADQEPYEDVAERVLAGFKEVVAQNEGKTVAIVSHGDPIRLLMWKLSNPEGDIPNMSILSKEGYLKRGEAFRIKIKNGKIVETELLSNLEGIRGERENYDDKPRRRGKER